MKKWGALGLAAVLLMSVWGCLPTEDPGKTQPPDSRAAVDVTESATTETAETTAATTAAATDAEVTTTAATTSVTTTQKPPTTVAATTVRPTATNGTTQQPSADGDMVWVSKTGKRYHSNPECSGMKSPSQIPLETARQRGLTPCQNCY